MSSRYIKLCNVPGTNLAWWIWQYTVSEQDGTEHKQTDYLLKREPDYGRSKVLLNADLAEVLSLRDSIDPMLALSSEKGGGNE